MRAPDGKVTLCNSGWHCSEKKSAAEMTTRYGAETSVLDWRESWSVPAAAAGRSIRW